MNDNRTLLDIANTALATIGAKPISSFEDDDSAAAQACSQMIKHCIEQAQSATDWQELKKTVELVPTGNKDERGYEYNAPADVLRIVELAGSENGGFWEREAHMVYTNASPAVIRYIRYSEKPSEWSTDLRGLVVEILAANLVGPVKGEWGARYQMLSHLRDEIIPAAVSANANASPGGNFYRQVKPYGTPFRSY